MPDATRLSSPSVTAARTAPLAVVRGRVRPAGASPGFQRSPQRNLRQRAIASNGVCARQGGMWRAEKESGL